METPVKMSRHRSFLRIRPRLCEFFCLALLAGVFGSQDALAHKVNLFAYVENGRIQVESFFPDGKPVVSGQIDITDSQRRKVAEGVTDAQGKFSVPIPVVDDLTITVDASMGHKNSFRLKKADLGG
jgi:nickel transport protein